MKKLFAIMVCALAIFSTHAAYAEKAVKWPDKRVKELSERFFRFSTTNGKQSLAPIPKPADDWFEKAINDHCNNTIVKLGTPQAALSIPGTSLILAFLECPASPGYGYDSIVALFDRSNLDVPLCFSRLDLMNRNDEEGHYYYGTIRSLETRKAGNKALHMVVTLSGADGGDSWKSLVILRTGMDCRTTILSKLYSSYSEVCCDKDCGGTRMNYRFVDDNTVELTTKDIIFKYGDSEKTVKTTNKNYDLLELYKNPQLRVFPSKTEQAAALLNSGDDLNQRDKDGTTPLMWAAVQGSLDLVKALVEKGAQVNAKDNRGRTALMIASYRAHPDVIELLLRTGADIKAMNKDGWSALMFAASGENVEVVDTGKANRDDMIRYGASGPTLDTIKLLIKKGLDPNARDKEGCTPLMAAAHTGHISVVKLLFEKGADVNAETTDGRTALSMAQAQRHPEVVTFLKAHGAKE
jgi:ankyrin repeat protein